MKPRRIVDSVSTHEGKLLELYQRDQTFTLEVDGDELMSSWIHGSEEALAQAVVTRVGDLRTPRLMIGGLGMGYTLRAALDALADRPRASIEVVEVFAAVVEWNQGILAHLAGSPLDDPRVEVTVADVADAIVDGRGRYNGILLDVDNGPDPFTLDSNRHLYSRRGVNRLHAALAPRGILGVWSAYDDRRFEAILKQAGFEVETRRVRARSEKRGTRHVLILGQRN